MDQCNQQNVGVGIVLELILFAVGRSLQCFLL